MQPAPEPNAGPLILCIDDELVGLRVRKILLERAGYQVLTAQNGPAGIEAFSQNAVLAVVLDFSMPGMSGGEVAKRMRSIKPNVPIMLLSAYTSVEPDVAQHITLSMSKTEGPPALLEKLALLISTPA